MVASLFTDYVDPSGGTVHYGAGPVVNFTGGVGPADLAAAQIDASGSIRRFTSQRRTARRAGTQSFQRDSRRHGGRHVRYNPGQDPVGRGGRL